MDFIVISPIVNIIIVKCSYKSFEKILKNILEAKCFLGFNYYYFVDIRHLGRTSQYLVP